MSLKIKKHPSSKGQAFSVLKLALAAAFAVTLLIIINQLVSGIDCPYSGFESVRTLTIDAMRVPGKCFNYETVCFNEEQIVNSLGLKTSIPGIDEIDLQCVGIHCTPGANGEVQFVVDTRVPVSAECPDDSSNCVVTFNKLCG
ncbi:MAG: hypothetical protein V1911_00080 [Candidatus Micrarchaeota archaeon]